MHSYTREYVIVGNNVITRVRAFFEMRFVEDDVKKKLHLNNNNSIPSEHVPNYSVLWPSD